MQFQQGVLVGKLVEVPEEHSNKLPCFMSNGRYMFAPSEISQKSCSKILEVVHSSEKVVINNKRGVNGVNGIPFLDKIVLQHFKKFSLR